MNTIDATVIDTPAGPLSLLLVDDTVIGAGFTTDPSDLHARLRPGRRARPLRRRPELGAASAAVQAYFAGDLQGLDDLAVDQEGTEHQRRLWVALRQVPPGTTVSYAELAARAGAPAAVRAAASACARNLVAPMIPCHRVVRSDGGLGGYYYGLDVKRWLLDHERPAGAAPC